MTSKVYGAAVVGEKRAAELLAATKTANRFGERVLGTKVDDSAEADAAREEASAAELEARLATQQSNRARPPATLTAEAEERLEELMKEKGGDTGSVSIADVRDIIEEMPEAYDRLLGWELKREPSPRIGALSYFLELEVGREQGPRPLVQSSIEKALTAARSKD